MEVQAFVCLHYGQDFLGYAIKSVYDLVDKVQVVYSPHASHGHRLDIQPPETESQLKQVAHVGNKVEWNTVTDFWHEGKHRDYGVALSGEGLVLVVDSDEIWHPHILEQALKMAWDGNKKNWLINFVTPWRSFDYVCRDNMWPVRIIDKRPGAEGIGYIPRELGEIYHFGYAIRDRIMRYKQQCHGHKDEWRKDWYQEKWKAWPPPPDCHPTCLDTWFPEPFDKTQLPEIMKDHHFYGKAMIE